MHMGTPLNFKLSASKSRSRPYVGNFLCLPLITKSSAQFLSDIQRLSRHNKNACTLLPPYVAGHPVDLKRLYNEVALRGGHRQVTASHEWAAVYAAMGLPAGCVESGHGLRSIYQRFLEPYERCQRMASRCDELEPTYVDTDSQDSDFTSKSSKVNYASNYSDTVPNHLRAGWNLSTELVDHFDYSNLENALRSNLPNELDFALNSMLLMSSQPSGFSLNKNVRLLSLLLQSVGICDTESPIQTSDSELTMHKRFLNFWHANILDSEGKMFLSSEAFGPHSEPTICETTAMQYSTLLELHDMTYGDDEGFRVQLVATVLRNLAVESNLSAVEIGRNPQALRFIFLCIYAKHSSLRQLGLETLSSLNFPVVGCLRPILARLLPNLLTSNDRNDQIRGLQLVRRLCESPSYLSASDRRRSASALQSQPGTRDRGLLTTDRNCEFLSMLPSSVFRCIISRLCLKDLHIVVLALDTVYSLSSLGSVLCERMLSSYLDSEQPLELLDHHSQILGLVNLLETLIALLRLEAQSMGSESLVRVRVMQALGTSTQSLKTPSVSTGTPSSTPAANEGGFLRPPSQLSSLPRVTQPSFTTLPTLPRVLAPPDPLVHSLRPVIPCTTVCQPDACVDTLQAPETNLPRPVHTPTFPVLKPSPVSMQTTSVCSVQPSLSFNSPFSSTTTTIAPRFAIVATPVSAPAQFQTSCVQSCVATAVTSLRSSIQTVSTPPSTEHVLYLSDIKSLRLTPQSRMDTKRTPVNSPLPRPIAPTKKTLSALKFTTNKPLRMSEALTISHATRRAYMFEWLRKNYAFCSNCTVPRIQIYSDYQEAHQRRFGSNTGGAISPIEFHSQLKLLFPKIEQIKVQTPGGNVEIHYHNLRHINSPEPKSTQGVNDIMAAVLCPRPNNMPIQSLTVKQAQKRRKVSAHRNLTDQSSVSSLNSDTGPPSKLVPKPTTTPLNGHNECSDALNVRTVLPVNGINKDVNLVLNHPHSNKIAIFSNGFQSCVSSVESTISQSGTVTTLSNCPKLNELVSRETGLVLLPVFTALNFHPTIGNVKGQNLVLPNPANAQKHINMSVCISPVQPRVCTPSSTSTATTVRLTLSSNQHAGSAVSLRDGNGAIRKSNDLQSQGNPDVPQNKQPAVSHVCVCRWDTCREKFGDRDHLIEHVLAFHCLPSTMEILCRWDGCSHRLLQTSRDVIIAHLADKHLVTSNSIATTKREDKPAVTSISALLEDDSPNLENSNSPIVIPSSPENSNSTELPVESADDGNPENGSGVHSPNLSKAAHVLTMQIPAPEIQQQPPDQRFIPNTSTSNTTNAEQSNESILAPVSVTAFHRRLWSPPPSISAECLKALAGGTPNPPFAQVPQREGPVTKHIRLTAALTLKNFLQYSATARRYVAASENLLCELAFSTLESAPIIFECLSYLNQRGAISPSLRDHGFLAQSIRQAGDPLTLSNQQLAVD